MARPSKFTPKVQEIILAGLRRGNYLSDCAALAGISYSCLRKWLRAGENGDPEFTQFALAAQKARSSFVDGLLTQIQSIAAETSNSQVLLKLLSMRSKQWGGESPYDALSLTMGDLESIIEEIQDEVDEAALLPLVKALQKRGLLDRNSID